MTKSINTHEFSKTVEISKLLTEEFSKIQLLIRLTAKPLSQPFLFHL
jgi:hypothetical protein